MLLHLSAIVSRLSKHYRLPVGLLVILFFLAASSRSLPAAASYLASPLVIDAFDQAPTQALSVSCCSGSDSSAVDNVGVLGGERDIHTTMLSGVFGTQNVFAGPPLNSLYHAQQPLMTGWTRVTWDGNDNDPINLDPTGLGGIDFTDGGNNSGLFVYIGSANNAANLVFTAYTDGANSSAFTLSLSGSTNNQGFFIPFSNFSGGADFTNIGAFELFIDGSATPGFQIFIELLTLSNYDFGDLPAAYNITTLANNGARHLIGDLYLGTAVDGEADGQVSPAANGDDTNGIDDEDGISIAGVWTVGANGGAVNVIASGAGCLSGWIDWNNNNNFTGTGEHIIAMVEVAAGSNTISFDIPAGTNLSNTFFSRFRLVPDTGASPDCSDDTPVGLTGEVINGEVEDYLLAPGATLSINDVTVDEGAGSAVFTVSLSALVNAEVSVNYATSNGTAVAPGDYTATSGTLIIPANTISNTISVTIIDDQLAENTETFTVNLSNAVNATIADGQGVGTILDNDNAPTADNDFYSTDEDTVLTVNAPGVLDNDDDLDGDPLTAVLNSAPANGAVSLNTDGSFVYTPTLNFFGLDSFTYHANDGFNNSNIAMVEIEVMPVNDPLTAVDDDAITDEDTIIDINVLANDIDPDGDAQVVAVTLPLNGIAIINPDSTVHYIPDADYYGNDAFQYTISDGVFTDTATVNITINPINDPPMAVDDADTTDEDVSVATNVLLNDYDIDGNIDPATLSVFIPPANGSAMADPVSGVITYTPVLDYYGVDSYVYEICDDGFPLPPACSTATVVITVTAVNDPPIAVDDTAITLEDTPIIIDVLANDINVDPEDTLTVTAVSQPANGAATINPDSTLTYTPTLGFTGADSFNYTVSDGVYTDTAVVNIIVVAPSDILGLKTVSGSFVEEGIIRYTIVLSNTGTVDQMDNPGPEFVDELPEQLSLISVQVVSGGGIINSNFSTVTWDGAIPGGSSVTLEIEASILPGYLGQVVSNQGQIFYDGDGDGNNEGITYTDDPTQPGIFDPTTFTIQEQQGPSVVFLPIIMNNMVTAPDLVITAVSASSSQIEVTIENQGSAATASGFWVDFYINPSAPPTGPNQLWYDLANEGLAWGVTALLAPGQTLTLIYSTTPGAPNQYFVPEESLYYGMLPAGTQFYVQVDSAREGSTYGGILETHEIQGGPYNNIASGTAVAP